MSLARLWLIPHDKPALDGAYMRYPLSAPARPPRRGVAGGPRHRHRRGPRRRARGLPPADGPARAPLLQGLVLRARPARPARGRELAPPRPRLPRHARHGHACRAGRRAATSTCASASACIDAGRGRDGARRATRRPRAHRRACSAPSRRHPLALARHARAHGGQPLPAGRAADRGRARARDAGQRPRHDGRVSELAQPPARRRSTAWRTIPASGHMRKSCERHGRDDRRRRLPTATYRLQFRAGMDFARTAGIVPYLAELGVSHLYASPLFQATEGSTHGYDVTDHRRFDDALGGMDGFCALSDALQSHGLGLILDIVPNHMAASVENPWWRDVLKNGREQPLCRAFRHRLVGAQPGPADPRPALWRRAGRRRVRARPRRRTATCCAITSTPSRSRPRPPPPSPRRPASTAPPTDDATLERLSSDRELIHRIHEAQNYRLAYWRLARDGLTNRRFFEISDLVGVRVEEPRVFDDVHRFLFEMIEAGRIDGVRIDHVDGLADPTGYLDRLARDAAAPRADLGREDPRPRRGAAGGLAGRRHHRLRVRRPRRRRPDRCARRADRSRRATTPSPATEHDYEAMRVEAKREILAPEPGGRALHPDRPRRDGADRRSLGPRLGPRQPAPGDDRHPDGPAGLPDLSARRPAIGGRPGGPRARARPRRWRMPSWTSRPSSTRS